MEFEKIDENLHKWAFEKAPIELKELKDKYAPLKVIYEYEYENYNKKLDEMVEKNYSKEDEFNWNRPLALELVNEKIRILKHNLDINKIDEKTFRENLDKLSLKTDSQIKFDIVKAQYYSILRENMIKGNGNEEALRKDLNKLGEKYPDVENKVFIYSEIFRSKQREKNFFDYFNAKPLDDFLADKKITEKEYRKELMDAISKGKVQFREAAFLNEKIKNSFVREMEENPRNFDDSAQLRNFYEKFSPENKNKLQEKYLEVLSAKRNKIPVKNLITYLVNLRFENLNLASKVDNLVNDLKNYEKNKNINNFEKNKEIISKFGFEKEDKLFRNPQSTDVEKEETLDKITEKFRSSAITKLKDYAKTFEDGKEKNKIIEKICKLHLENRNENEEMKGVKEANETFEIVMNNLSKEFPSYDVQIKMFKNNVLEENPVPYKEEYEKCREKLNMNLITEDKFRDNLKELIDFYPEKENKIYNEILISLKRENLHNNNEKKFQSNLKTYAKNLEKGKIRDEFIGTLINSTITENSKNEKKFIDKMNSLKNLFPDKKNEIQKMTEDVLIVSKVKVVSGKKEKDKSDSFKR